MARTYEEIAAENKAAAKKRTYADIVRENMDARGYDSKKANYLKSTQAGGAGVRRAYGNREDARQAKETYISKNTPASPARLREIQAEREPGRSTAADAETEYYAAKGARARIDKVTPPPAARGTLSTESAGAYKRRVAAIDAADSRLERAEAAWNAEKAAKRERDAGVRSAYARRTLEEEAAAQGSERSGQAAAPMAKSWSPVLSVLRGKTAEKLIESVDNPLPGSNRAFLSDREKQTVRYLAENGRIDDAEKYLDGLDRTLNARQFAQQKADIDRSSKAGRIAAGLSSTASAPMAYLQTLEQRIRGEQNPDINAGAIAATRAAGYAQEKSLENRGQVGKFLGGVGYSMAQNLATMALGPAGAAMWLGLSAAGDTATDVLERDGNADRALALGAVSGAVETLTEKMGLDNLFRIAGKAGAGGVRKFLGSMLSQAGSEAAEETISEFANTIADLVIMGKDAEYRKYIRDLEDGGMSRRQAVSAANAQFFAINPGLAGLGGAVSGAIFGAGGELIPRIGKIFGAKKNAAKNTARENEKSRLPEAAADGKEPSAMNGAGDMDGESAMNGTRVEDNARVEETVYTDMPVPARDANRNTMIAEETRVTDDTRVAEDTRVPDDTGTEVSDRAMSAEADGMSPAPQDAVPLDRAQQMRTENGAFRTEKEITAREAKSIIRSQKRNAYAVDFIADVTRDTGLQVRYYDAPEAGENGYSDGTTIWINVSGPDRNPVNVVFRHELTHTLRRTNAAAYQALSSYAMENADADALTSLRAEMAAQYERVGAAFDDTVFTDELCARLAERVLTDDMVAESMAKSRPEAAQGVLGWIKRIMRRLYRLSPGARQEMRTTFRHDEVFRPEGMYSQENLSRVRTLLEQALSGKDASVRSETSEAGENAKFADVSENGKTVQPQAAASARSSIRTGFDADFSKWLDNTDVQDMKTAPGYFKLGMTSDAMKKLGAKNVEVFWRKSKIGYILEKHEGMDRDTLKRVPEDVIDNPVMVLKSKTEPNSVVLIGTLDAKNGDPVVASMSLMPTKTGSLRGDFNLITSVYDKQHIESLIKDSEVLYLDGNRKRTEARLMQLRVQFPSRQSTLGSIGTISYANGKVKLQGRYIFRKENGGTETGQESSAARQSVQTGKTYQTAAEQRRGEGAEDPTDMDKYVEMLNDTEYAVDPEESQTLKTAAVQLGGDGAAGVGNSKDISRNFDIAARKSEKLREVLRDTFERPLYEAKRAYTGALKTMYRELRENTIDLGIRPGSRQSAAVMWLGEGQRQASPPNAKKYKKGSKYETVPYTLEDLKRDFPDRAKNGKYEWENIVQCERWMRKTYDAFVERINRVLEIIYPDVLTRAEADLAALDAQIEKYRAMTDVEGTTAKIDELNRMRDEAAAALERFREDPRAVSDALRQLQDKIDEARFAYSRRRNLDSKAAAEELARIEAMERRWESLRTAEEQRLTDAYNEALQNAQRAAAAERASRESRLSRTRAVLAETENTARQLREDIESGAIYKNKRLLPRKDYFHHYMEQQQSGFLADLTGITANDAKIDPELVGLSEFTQPNTKFTGFMQKRLGGRYVEDAVGGMLRYIPQAEYKINIEQVIPKFRAAIRDIAQATKKTKNCNQLIGWLIDFTNDLAGKTNPIDRGVILKTLGDVRGRQALRAMEKLNGRLKANAVTFNLGSALVQVSNLPNILAYVKNPVTYAAGAFDGIRLLAGNKELRQLRDSSVFLSERYMDKVTAQFAASIRDKAEAFSGALLRLGDEAVATSGWFALYRQGIRRGMDSDAAVYYADEFTRRAVAGRGVGEIPLAQKSRLVKVIAPFQVEVQNTWNLLMEKGFRKTDAAGLLSYAVSTFLLNLALQVFGRSAGLDIIGAIGDIIKLWVQDDGAQNKPEKVVSSIGRLAGEVVSNVPMINQILPAVIPDADTRQKFFGESDPTKYGVGNMGINAVLGPAEDLIRGEDVNLLSPIANYAMPMGGKQTERIVRALQSYGILPKVHLNTKDGASVEMQETPGVYTASGNLRFAIDTSDPANAAAGLLLGLYNTKEGRAYSKSGRGAYSETQTNTGRMARKLYGIDDEDAAGWAGELAKIRAERDENGRITRSARDRKIDYIRSLDLTPEQKQGLFLLTVDTKGLSHAVIYGAFDACYGKDRDALVEYIKGLSLYPDEKETLYQYMSTLFGEVK